MASLRPRLGSFAAGDSATQNRLLSHTLDSSVTGEDGSRLYVTLSSTDQVVVIDTATNKDAGDPIVVPDGSASVPGY